MADAKQAAFAGYQIMLTNWGIAITPEVQSFINQAVNQKWSSSQFLIALRKTKFYAQAFPGIMRGNGTPRMSEAQYMAYSNSVKDYAATQGINLSNQQVGLMVKQGISASEARDRITALDKLRTNHDLLQNFAEYLTQKDLAPKGGITKKDLFNFVMKQGPKAWEQEWDMAYTAAQLEQVGIDVGKPKKGGDIGFKNLSNMLNRAKALGGIDPSSLTAQDFEDIYQAVQAIPIGQLYGIGITKKDAIAMKLGVGQKKFAATTKIQRALATYAARFQDQANPQLVGGPRGTQLLTGNTQVQATE